MNDMCVCTCSIVYENKYCHLALWGSAAQPPLPLPHSRPPSAFFVPRSKNKYSRSKKIFVQD